MEETQFWRFGTVSWPARTYNLWYIYGVINYYDLSSMKIKLPLEKVHKRRNHYEFEYFDPAGRDGDRKSIQKLKKWTEQQLPKLVKKRVKFVQSRPFLNFQSDEHDVMCQTWIWYWVYFRTVRKIRLFSFYSLSDNLINFDFINQSCQHCKTRQRFNHT